MDDVEPSDLLFWNTLIAYYTSYDPRTLDDWSYAWTIKHLKEIRTAEAKANKVNG